MGARKNARELSPSRAFFLAPIYFLAPATQSKILLKTLTSWLQRDKNIAGKSHIDGHKENRLKLFKSRRHFGEIKQPKTLNQPQ